MNMFAVSVVLLLPTLSLAVEVSGDHPVRTDTLTTAASTRRRIPRHSEQRLSAVPVESLPDVTTGAPAPDSVNDSPVVQVFGADDIEHRRVDEALGRFAVNGLALPDLDVHFFDDEAACKGHQGLFQQRYEPWRVVICGDLEFVVTHEFAHAWEAANVDDAGRAHYVEHRGLPTWDGGEFEWLERGVEDVAFTIQQILMATANRPLTSSTWVERAAAYELITGRPCPLATA